MNTSKSTLKTLTEGAIMVALSVILSLFPIHQMPLGGDVTIAATLPICIYAFRRGSKNGFLAAFAYSLFQLLLGLKNLTYATSFVSAAAIVLFDYVVAYTLFGVIGYIGKIKPWGNERLSGALTLSLGAAVACVLRFLCHLVSGAVVWYGLTKEWYADDPGHIVFSLSEWGYSFVYNVSYMIPETVVTVVAAFLLASILNFRSPDLRYKALRTEK